MPSCHAAPHFARRGGFYRCIPFEEFDWLAHGFSTRNARPPPGIVTLRQVHSAHVFNARGLADRAAEGDALVSHETGTLVGVRTADCVPILLAGPLTRAVAAIHAGWRGTVAGIARHTVDVLRKEFGTEPCDLHAAIGPSIRVCCYEVGPEVARQFLQVSPELKLANNERGRARLDLVEANTRMLVDSGVPRDRIFDSGLCTVCCPAEFHSYRRDPQDTGRMTAFIGRTL